MIKHGIGMEAGTVILAVGALAATLLGAELVARQDKPTAWQNSAPQMMPAALPPELEKLELAPIPRALAPVLRPVARSRSSR